MAGIAFDIPMHQSQNLTADEIRGYQDQIRAELERQDAVLVAHYYTDDAIQALADETGGCVSMHGSSAATKFSMSPAVLEMYLRNGIPSCISFLHKRCMLMKK